MQQHDSFADVRNAITLSQYVESTYGSKLRSRGPGKYTTACPVHGGDNVGAFSIDDNKGLWYCFSQCGRGGDVFDLYRAQNESAGLKDALVALASHAGIVLPERERSVDKRSLHQIMKKAAALFEDALVSERPKIGDSAGAEDAYLWLRDTRHLGDDEMEYAQLGFVPDFPGLRAALEDALGPRGALMQCGLLVESAAGNVYCPFAGRVVFPIRDDRARVIGFGARVVPGVTRHQEPKFVNTRQTDIYDKSQVVYGMDLVDEHTRRVIVCEGYMDALAINSLGDRNVVGVASCGTSITRSHLDVLNDLLPDDATVTFAMDGDAAGRESMARLSWAAQSLGPRGFGILFDEAKGKDPWERYVAGTLAQDVDVSEQRPLLDVTLSAARALAGDDADFDAIVSSMISESRDAQFRDEVLRAASAARGQSVGEYGESVRRVEMRERRRGAQPVGQITLTGPVRHLVARLLQIPPADLQGVASAFGAWDDDTRGLIERWLPVTGRADVEALGYVLFPRAERFESEIVQAVSSCMNLDDAAESIAPTLNSMSKVVLSGGARVSRSAKPAVIRRVKALRPLATSNVPLEDEVEHLVLLVDVARELDRVRD